MSTSIVAEEILLQTKEKNTKNKNVINRAEEEEEEEEKNTSNVAAATAADNTASFEMVDASTSVPQESTMVASQLVVVAKAEPTSSDFDASAFLDEQIAASKREFEERERVRMETESQEKKNMFQFNELELADIEQPGLLKVYDALKKKMFEYREKICVSEEMCYVVLHKGRKYAGLSFALIESIRPIMCLFFVYTIVHMFSGNEFLRDGIWSVYMLSVLVGTTVMCVIPAKDVLLVFQLNGMIDLIFGYKTYAEVVAPKISTMTDIAGVSSSAQTGSENKVSNAAIVEIANEQTVDATALERFQFIKEQIDAHLPSVAAAATVEYDTALPQGSEVKTATTGADASLVPAASVPINSFVSECPATPKDTVHTRYAKVFAVVYAIFSLVQMYARPAMRTFIESRLVAKMSPIVTNVRTRFGTYGVGAIIHTIALRPGVDVIGSKILSMFVFAAINLLLASMGCFTTSILILAMCMNYLTYVYASARIMQDILVAAAASVLLLLYPFISLYGNAAVITYYCTAFACHFTSANVRKHTNVSETDVVSLGKHMVFLFITASVLYIAACYGAIHLYLDKASMMENSAHFFFVQAWFLYTESHYLVLPSVNNIIMSAYLPITLQETYFLNVALLLLASFFGGMSHFILVSWGQFIAGYLVCWCYTPPRCISQMRSMFSFQEMLNIANLEKTSPKRWVRLDVDASNTMDVPSFKNLFGNSA